MVIRWSLLWFSLGVAAAAVANPEGDRLYQSAVTKYGAKDYRGAIADAEAAVAADPANWQAWQLDGNARYAMGDTAGAVTVYDYALRIHPDNPGLKSFVDSLKAPAPAPAATPAAASTAVEPATGHPAGTSRGYRIGACGGYQMVGLESFERYFHDLYDPLTVILTAFGYTPKLEITVPSAAVEAGVEVSRALRGTPFCVGMRAGTLLVPDVTSRFSMTSSSSSQLDEYTLSFGVIRIMAGGIVRATEVGPVRLGGGLWAGWTMLNVDWTNHGTYAAPGSPSMDYDRTGKMELIGGGFALTAEVEAALPVTTWCEVFLEAGYTINRMTEVLTDRAYDSDGDGTLDFPAGALVADKTLQPVVYDLGGAGGRAGVRILF